MSHSVYAVRFGDGTVKYGLYRGSSQVFLPPLFDDPHQPWSLREMPTSQQWPDFESGSGEVVEVCSFGSVWTATATREVLTSWHSEEQLIDRFEQENEHLWPHWPEQTNPEWARGLWF